MVVSDVDLIVEFQAFNTISNWSARVHREFEKEKKKSCTVSSIGRVELGLGDVSKTCTTCHIGLRSSQDQALQSGGGLVITHPIPALLAQGLPQQERGLVILAQEGCSTRPLISSLRSG